MCMNLKYVLNEQPSAVVVVLLLNYINVHGKQLWSCRNGQLTYFWVSAATLDPGAKDDHQVNPDGPRNGQVSSPNQPNI